ncbi:hypothetical protein HNQ43_001124 [Faecalicoccus acidiformans]|uniref:AAA+ ATPase domain-containing protein n=1 Tax=Faecalicoccus acidiformans TaxID=915173 RepID=A0A7W8D3X4_9FIRM|nr:ATP-binding protein [Faecalicoccus acidiformans]MBB5185075.1 hypothetical protein [Faecalicoccus acidiformans]
MSLRVLSDVQSFTVFKALDKDKVIHNFYRLLLKEDMESYSDFVSSLYKTGTDDWTQYLYDKVMSLENCIVKNTCEKKDIPHSIQEALSFELGILQELSQMVPDDFKMKGFKASWVTHSVNFESEYYDRLSHIEQFGFGDYARFTTFRLELTGQEPGFVLKPVEYPDPICFSDLIGYDLQRQQVIANTEILLKGRLASNVLLYGDAGTGKSATVKAIANEFSNRGLRLIELGKKELHLLPKLLDLLAKNPLKFILFIDDLSFQENDDDFSALKAVLEGSVSVRSNNTVIYATSNRRHIVKETFQAREGDEIHRNDTMQETISLSERFGMKVYYEKPKKDLYQEIVFGLADQYGLNIDREILALKAEQFALRKAGRSARAARQLIEQLSAQEENPR